MKAIKPFKRWVVFEKRGRFVTTCKSKASADLWPVMRPLEKDYVALLVEIRPM